MSPAQPVHKKRSKKTHDTRNTIQHMPTSREAVPERDAPRPTGKKKTGHTHKHTTSTETKKQSPKTGARAKHTLGKSLGYPIREPARQSACEARP